MILLIDCDETLYPHSAGIMNDIGTLINRFMLEVMQHSQDEVTKRRRFYIDTYGTTLNGLMKHENVNPVHYCEFVHQLDLSKYIEPNPDLPSILNSIEHPKILFTNAPKAHADKVLQLLNITQCFDAGFYIEDFQYESKPKLDVFQFVDNAVRSRYPTAKNVVFVDDYIRNLQSAKKVNWNTVWVGGAMPSGLYHGNQNVTTGNGKVYSADEIRLAADVTIQSINLLPEALKQLPI